MRSSLDKQLRKKLEATVVEARDVVEVAVTDAITRLGIADVQAPSYLSEDDRKLRNTLRAHARQLGDSLIDGAQETELLINEIAYEHWHRMLFSRYLEQNHLLMFEGTSVTLDECSELAEEEPDCKDGWELAGRLAQTMLPQIFRADSPAFAIKLSINHINKLEELIAALNPATFQAQDSLGWCYQFWQNKKKKQVNESGVKIGAKELSPVTQLFTEPYMVSFLLDNALGAWWAKRRLSSDDLIRANSEQELRELASIPGVPLEYLRFIEEEEVCSHSGEKVNKWKSAAGDFDKWPEHLSELKTLDPCCGSGHFLVAVFLMLVPMRMHLEGLTAKEAVNAVLRDNIHGLELDQRCVELAAFALALEAWRYPDAGGYRQLPELQLACSGMSITEAQKEWKDLAKGDEVLSDAVTWMQQTFKEAPTLGSLIDPTKALPNKNEGEQAPWELLQLAMVGKADATSEAKAAAQGLAKAAGLLADKYQWVVTNVPYLARGKQSETLQLYCDKYYIKAKSDLATVFLQKCLELCLIGGSSSVVIPQNWLFLKGYQKFRSSLLDEHEWNVVARLGAKGFQTSMWDFNVQLIGITRGRDNTYSLIRGIDVSEYQSADKKSDKLPFESLKSIIQLEQLKNPDAIVSFENADMSARFSETASCYQGSSTGDNNRFVISFWEYHSTLGKFQLLEGVPSGKSDFSGKQLAIDWYGMEASKTSAVRGWDAFNKKGVSIGQMANLPASLYLGRRFPNTTPVIVPSNNEDLEAIWAFCCSDEFAIELRKINQKLSVDNGYVGKIPFDRERWNLLANKQFPNGLPKPYSDDPTQWIFHGHPCASVIWDEETKTTAVGELRQDDTVLQVAVARLLGYQWPAELDDDKVNGEAREGALGQMELAPEMRQVMLKNTDFDGLVDDDGIVCIPAIRGEMSAVKRLEAILQKAYGQQWSNTIEANLLKAVKSTNLGDWLRDKLFEQHCKLFQHRPFIWQIWDGLKDGFSALVNYHQLDYKGLERLIYTYLDDWISTQKRGVADGIDGADIRLTAAENLKVQLEAILEGEALPGKPGLDIFVRWKPIEQQAIGWNPDLNDGVRLNIRPFMSAEDMGKKGAGVLRAKPNIHWKKDRGTDVASAPWFELGPKYDGKEGDRINDHHLTLAEKRAARESAKND
ncbi:N-6 DNA methylase [Shewanella sp. VB17]|uniref:Eco57I restriction-modification methylase domain-containing protein n=1 Tax=Shewanella sp. VB17 TaxID=2739432 RepID=UPI0015654B95|nr:N-6 DNA methylase [Shewanella sp. VB17]NRD74014.1 N-6 DNA methylase [Shewanella sp. VB17]